MAFKETDLMSITNNTTNNKSIKSFMNDLKNILSEHGARLHFDQCELFLNNCGYVGFIEDNIDTIDLVESGEVIVSLKK